MNKNVMIDLPALCQGNQYGVNITLFLDTLREIKGLKHPNLLLGESDQIILASNPDYTFTRDVWQFLSDVQVSLYGKDVYKSSLTHNPDILDTGYEKDLLDAIYLQLCVLHEMDRSDRRIVFVGFIPRFASRFVLETVRDKKTRKHHTEIFSCGKELQVWIDSCWPKLAQKKHGPAPKSSKMGTVSPFSSFYAHGASYAEGLLRKAYLESEDESEFPHYLYTWDPEAETFVEFRHENHDGDSHHDYHGRDLSQSEFGKVPSHLRLKYHR